MIGKTIDQLRVGDRAEFGKTISESDIYLYAGITGDFNPAHVNEVYAQKTFFQNPDCPRDAHRRIYFCGHCQSIARPRNDLHQAGIGIPGPGPHGRYDHCRG